MPVWRIIAVAKYVSVFESVLWVNENVVGKIASAVQALMVDLNATIGNMRRATGEPALLFPRSIVLKFPKAAALRLAILDKYPRHVQRGQNYGARGKDPRWPFDDDSDMCSIQTQRQAYIYCLTSALSGVVCRHRQLIEWEGEASPRLFAVCAAHKARRLSSVSVFKYELWWCMYDTAAFSGAV